MSSINFPNYNSNERPANEVARDCINDYESTLKYIAQHLQFDQSIEELVSAMKPEITFIKSAFKAITSPDEDAISQAFDEIFRSSISLDRKIAMTNSILESVHTKTSFYVKWRKMGDEVQKLLDDPNIENKESHVNLKPLSKLVQDLQIPSLTQFYADATLHSYEQLSSSKLENSKSLANQVNITKERLSWIIETHEFFISESFTKKIEQIKKTVYDTKTTHLQNLSNSPWRFFPRGI
ncbi:MAG: hypothetical protein VX777_05450 [Chlamydiota bacterium]|nr:hypothetical protein [Chlamydiota bacterium]